LNTTSATFLRGDTCDNPIPLSLEPLILSPVDSCCSPLCFSYLTVYCGAASQPPGTLRSLLTFPLFDSFDPLPMSAGPRKLYSSVPVILFPLSGQVELWRDHSFHTRFSGYSPLSSSSAFPFSMHSSCAVQTIFFLKSSL